MELVCSVVLVSDVLYTLNLHISQCKEIANGIAYLHEKDIVHSDLKGVRLNCDIQLHIAYCFEVKYSGE